MYRKQLTLQKILCFAAIVAGALVFLYALGLMTDMYDSLYYTMMDPSNPDDTWVPGSQIYYHMQPFNRQLLNVSIGLILLSCLLFITGTHSRRRYYVGNVISTALFAGAGVAASVWIHGEIESFRAEYLQISFADLEFFADMMGTAYIESTFWFDIHWAVCGLVVLVAALLLINLALKFSLMRAEKKLIDEGRRATA